MLMLDESLIIDTPPLYGCCGRVGQQVSVPVSGSRKKRLLHRATYIWTGDVAFCRASGVPTTRRFDGFRHRFITRAAGAVNEAF